MNPASSDPAPIPTRSRLNPFSSELEPPRPRTVAADWASTTSEMASAGSRSARSAAKLDAGAAMWGRPAGTTPSTSTPCDLRWNAATASALATRAMIAPGNRLESFSAPPTTTRTAPAMAMVQPFVWPMARSVSQVVSTGPWPVGAVTPSTMGIWRRMMAMPTPARKPVTTGAERMSAIQAILASPMTITMSPTSSASSEASAR